MAVEQATIESSSDSIAGGLGAPGALRVALLIETSSSWGSEVVAGIGEWLRKNTGPGVGKRWATYIDFRGYYEATRLPELWHGHGVIARVTSKDLAEQLKQANVPCVNVSQIRVEGYDFQQVCSDETAAGNLAAETLLATGMTNFAYVASYKREFYTDHVRRSFEGRLKGAGLGPVHVYEPDHAFRTDQGPHDTLEPLTEWVRSLPKPIAILTWNGLGAHRVTEACTWARIAVPQFVSVLAAQDDALVSQLASPPTTSIDIASRRVGYLAAAELSRLMTHAVIGRPIVVPNAGMIWRQSVLNGRVDDELVTEAIAYLRGHFHEDTDVQAVADVICVSRRTLELRFKATLGIGPVAYLQRLRLQEAQRLLVETDLLLKQIANQVGFRTGEHMQRLLRAETGLSPTQYRNLHWRARKFGEKPSND